MTETDPVENGEVRVGNGRILEVGQGISGLHPDIPVRDLGRAALLPGFVNAHSHLEPTFRRNCADGLNLWQWLGWLGFRRDATPSPELLRASAGLGAAECLRSGITCLGECSFSGAASEAMASTGLRGVLYREVFGQSMGDDYRERISAAIDELLRGAEALPERISVGLSPHSVYTSGPDMLRFCAESCAKLGIPVAMHLAETRSESDYTVSGTGPLADMRRESFGYEPMVSGVRPLRVVERAGLLRPGTILAHCVHLTDDEIDAVASSGAGVAHCPRSNAYLGAGVARLGDMRRAGVPVGLGTDSAASCLTLDFFEEMRFALGLRRATAEDAGALLAKDVLKLATAGGADALGLGDCVGRLAPGMRADMIAVDMSAMLPGQDVHLAVISRTPADVTLRLIDGIEVEPDVEAAHTELRELMEYQGRE